MLTCSPPRPLAIESRTMAHWLIQGGRVIDPASGLDATADVLIRGGRVEAVGDALAIPEDTLRIDAEGCLVTPGLIDTHVHLRDPDTSAHHEETIATGARAAVAGGFTTVCCMPNTTPALDSVAIVQHVFNAAQQADACRVFPVACGTVGRAGTTPAPIEALVAAGAVGISDDGDGIADDTVMADVLRAVQAADSVFMQHCQDPAMTPGAAMNAGAIARALGVGPWPREAEVSMLQRDVDLNRDIGARYHAQHMSAAESMDVIAAARAEGQQVSGEAAPHHLLLTEEACSGGDPLAKVNPPLRTAADVQALRQAVADGVITVLATDHAPHPAASKAVDFQQASFGMSAIEICLPLYREALIDSGAIDWPRLIAMMTIEGARLAGLDARGLGRLSPGGVADVTIIDPNHAWQVDPATFLSKGTNTPFAWRALQGRSVATICDGRLIHEALGDRAPAGIEPVA